jgi:hypothetical protein
MEVQLDLYRSSVDAMHLEVRTALANWAIVVAAGRQSGLRDRIHGTLHSGYAAEVILNSCTELALLAAFRPWDEAADPPLCDTVANPMRTPELRASIASVQTRAGVSPAVAVQRMTTYGKCASRQRHRARRARRALQPIRNRWLAHRQVSVPVDGGTHFFGEGGAQFPTICFLNLVYRAHLVASGADLLLDPDNSPLPFRTLRADFIENASAFWSAYASAPVVCDDLGRPI